MQVVSFLQKCINFVEQRMKFSHIKGSIISEISEKKAKYLKKSVNLRI